MKPIWLRSYQTGVPQTIDPDKFPSLNALFNWVFHQYKNLPAFCNQGTIKTFEEIDSDSRKFATFLRLKLGLVKGQKFAIMMPNILQYPVAVIGILRAGGVVVNVNILYNADDVAIQMRDSEAIGILVSENYAHIVAEALPNTKLKHVIVAKFNDPFAAPKAFLVNFIVKRIKKLVPKYSFKQRYKYKNALKFGAKYPYQEVSVSNSDVALLQYTGGTTGLPKGAMLTHRNIQAGIYQINAWMQPYVEPGKEIVVTLLPLFHISGMMTSLFPFMYNGGLNILITNPLDTKEFVKAVKPYAFTTIAGVNRLFNALLNEPDFAKLNFSRLKVSASSGMALQHSVALRWKNVTKKTLIQAYSQTETSLGISCNPLNSENTENSVGLPISSTEISIRNDTGAELDVNYPGEIWVRGPQVMLGYWRNEQETKNVLTSDGWFKTGDIGIMDENGYLRLIDRKKDVIYIMGFQVFPSEVEAVINSMPDIKESTVVDAHDEVLGEVVKAFVVSNNPKITADQIIEYCQERLPYYKVPKLVEFRPDLPKNSIGKILRRELRSEHWTFG